MTPRARYVTALIVSALLAASVSAETDESTTRLEDEIAELRRALLARDEVIRNLLERLEALEQRVTAGESTPPREPVAPADDETRRAEEAIAAAAAEERREQERLVRAAFEQTLIDRGGLLLPPRTLEVEPSLSFVSSSSDRIVIDGFTILPVLVVGDIVNERIRSEIVQSTATFRLGLPFDLQLEARIPYGFQRRRTVTAENEERREDNLGLGDVELGISHQLVRGGGWVPDLLASFRWKTTTGDDPFDVEDPRQLSLGSGFDSYSASMTAVRVADPVVFFGGISYTYNDAVNAEVGRFNSGNTLGGQLGLAIALNLDTSVSFAFDQQFTASSKLDGERLPGSSLVTGTFAVGASYSLSPDLTLDFGVRIGVTQDSPDVQVTFGMPVRFRL